MIMTSLELMGQKEKPGRRDIRNHLSGNLCRCTGYQKIVDAVEAAVKTKAED
jgi:carbon-monoxide dehydrogenase small subunit